MKNLLTKYLLLCYCLFPHPATAQTPTHYDYEYTTEAEVRAFMQEVLWFCNYGRHIEDKPEELFMGFLEDSLQQMLKKQDNIRYDYSLYGALVSKIEWPWVEVLATSGADTRNWRQVKRFRIGQKEGKLYLIPYYEKTWATTTVRAWQEAYEIPIRPATEAEKSAIREDVMGYLDHSFPKAEPVEWAREQLLGHWRIDSTYFFQNGKKMSSFSLAELLLLYDGKFYNVNGAYMAYGGYFLDHPGWWGLRNNHLFTSDGIQVDLLSVEEVTPHRILLKRYNAYSPVFLMLSNLPKAASTVDRPIPIGHPDVEVVLQPTYDYIGVYQDTLAEVRSGDYYSLIGQSGKPWLPLVYDQLLPFHGRAFTYGQRDGQWYKINAEGEEAEALPYEDFIDPRDGNHLLVKDKSGKVGAIDQEGEVIVPFKYEMVFPHGDNIFEVVKNRKTGLVGQNGQVIIPTEYDLFMEMENGLCLANVSGKQGLLDPATGRVLIEPEYEDISRGDRYYQAKRNGRLVLFDEAFQKVKLPDYELMIYLDGGYLGVEEDGKRGIVNMQGDLLIPIAYDDIWLTSAGIKVKQQGRLGLLDYDGAIVIPMAYDELEPFDELISVKKEGRWGLLDHSGKELLPAVYDGLYPDHMTSPVKHCKVNENGKVRLINLKGEYIIATPYDEVHFPRPLFPGSEDKWYAFEDNGKHGYLNGEGEVAIPAMYDYMVFFEPGGYAVAELDGKQGVIDTENRMLVPFIFDLLNFQPSQPVIVVQYEGFYGLIENPVYDGP